MIPVSSLHKCSHLYNNLESFHFFIPKLFTLFLLCSPHSRTVKRESSSRSKKKRQKQKKTFTRSVCCLHPGLDQTGVAVKRKK